MRYPLITFPTFSVAITTAYISVKLAFLVRTYADYIDQMDSITPFTIKLRIT